MGRLRTRHGTVTAAVATGVVLLSLAAGRAAVLARSRSSRAVSPTPRALSIACPSAALGGSLPAEIYLPAGYRSRGRRYPVIYFLHGLPANPDAYTQNGFVAASLAAARRQAIVVAPQGARTVNSDREYLDWSATENWPAAISHDLTDCVDARFHTIADRYGRALMGLSAGGYGAFNIGLRSLVQFGAVESWSGYFDATDPGGHHILSLGSVEAQDAATVPTGSALREQLAAWPTMIGFYIGSQDGRFLAMNEQYHASLRHSHIAHTFDVYPGGHSYALWRAHAQKWLDAALTYLASGRRRHLRSSGGGSSL
jgi:enterochelin esterase-like enzyme